MFKKSGTKTGSKISAKTISPTKKFRSARKGKRVRKASIKLPVAYAGTIYFEDEDVIEVSRLVIYPEFLLFELVTTWEGERWERSGRAFLREGFFVSNSGISKSKVTGVTTRPSTLTFRLGKMGPRRLVISGSWLMDGEKTTFNGTLGPFRVTQ